MALSAKLPPRESRAHTLVATLIAFLVLDFIFIALRFWSRRLQWKKFRADDYFVIAALVVICAYFITAILAVKLGGVGHHIHYITKAQRIHSIKAIYMASAAIYLVSVSLPKLAVVCIYLQIFMDKPSRICCWAIVFALVVGPIICTGLIIFQCTPINFLWNKTLPHGGHCFNPATMWRYGSLPNIITDVMMLVLPMPLIWKLHTSMKVKVGLSITFVLGSIGLVTSILRFVVFFESIADGTWAAVTLMCWSIIEPSIYLWAACLLAFKPLLRYATQESSLSRKLRSWYGTKTAHSRTLPYAHNSGATRLPSNEEERDNKISRERDYHVDHSVDSTSTEAFGMYSLPGPRR